MKQTVSKQFYKGIISIPSSKSDTQRAVLIAGLGRGESIIKNCGKSKDELGMLHAIEKLGAEVTWISATDVSIKGITKITKSQTINLGESGLGFRLLASASAIFDQEIILQAEGSLLLRPMNFFDEVLPKLGVKLKSNQGFPPIKVKGPIQGSRIEVDGSLSSQFLSGLLIALPFANEDSKIQVTDLKSIPYVEMTISTLKEFGISIENHQHKEFRIKGKQKVTPTTYEVEGDWSSASYWLVASALGLDISVRNLSLESLQADRAILDVFKRANCSFLTNDGLLKIDGSSRTSFDFDATHCPDLFPALAVLAALTEGETKIKGVHRLIHKESNRALAIQKEFGSLGIETQILGDELIIFGKKSISGGIVASHNDHRMAMSLAILAMFSETPIVIEGAESVTKSYPTFWEDLDGLKH